MLSLMFDGGFEVSSGQGMPSIKKVVLTESVNGEELLMPGAVCTAMLEVTAFVDPAYNPFAAGRRMELYTEDETGQRTKNGVFYAEKVEWTGLHTCVVTAYDVITLLDREVTSYLQSLTAWPYSLQNLARLVCNYCALSLTTPVFPNGTFKVLQPPAYDRLYGRQIIKWICQLAGRFCRATADGKVEFGWYTPAAVRVGLTDRSGKLEAVWRDGDLVLEAENVTATADGLTVPQATCYSGQLRLQVPDVMPTARCYLGGFRRGNEPVNRIGGVWLAYSYASIGDVYPETGGNVMSIVGNPLLENATASELRTMTRTLFEQMNPINYTVCRLKVPTTAGIRPGEILEFTDGVRTFTTYVMRTVRTGPVTEIISTGEYRRDNATAINNRY